MNTRIECFPCFLRQTVLALHHVPIDEVQKEEVVKAVLADMEAGGRATTPAHTMTFIYRKIKALTGVDPYERVKKDFNERALALLPGLRQLVAGSPDPLWTAARLAIAGNIIDFGIFQTFDIEGTITRALSPAIDHDDMESFREAVNNNKHVLYLLDNSGEIVFDMLLIEVLQSMGKEVTAVVRGGPVINDAVMEDAAAVGLTALCRVIHNGTDAVGTDFAFCSGEFMEEFHRSALVISKGQANFETLIGSGKNIFFLLQAKCDVVAAFVGLTSGAMLLMHNVPGYKNITGTP